MRKKFQESPSLELAFLDIGASSEDEARAKGVAMLDAVTPWREVARLAGDKMAGHSLGLKFCSALLLDAATQAASDLTASNPSFVWMAQTKLLLRRSRPPSALGAFRTSRELEAEHVVIVDVFPCEAVDPSGIAIGIGPVLVYSESKEIGLKDKILKCAQDIGISLQLAPDYSTSVMEPFVTENEQVIGLFLPVKFSQTPSEVVDTRDAEALSSLLLALLQEGRM
jgi:putative aminopeptidase FrvX